MFKLFRKEKGFTLIELMIVVSIIAILAAVVATQIGNTTSNTRVSTKATDVDTIQGAVDRYYADTGVYPYVDAANAATMDAVVTAGTYVVSPTTADTMLEEIDIAALVSNEYLRSEPYYAGTYLVTTGDGVTFDTTNNKILVDANNNGYDELQFTLTAGAIDLDADGTVDATFSGTAGLNLTSAWFMDSEGNVICVIPAESYGIDSNSADSA